MTKNNRYSTYLLVPPPGAELSKAFLVAMCDSYKALNGFPSATPILHLVDLPTLCNGGEIWVRA